jgi:hypothetical protein
MLAYAPKAEFPEAIQRDSTCPVPARKILRFCRRANHLYNFRRPVPKEGRWPSSRTLGRDAATKDDTPWLKLAVFGKKRTEKNCLRNDLNVVEISGVEVDYDDEVIAFDDAIEIMTGRMSAACCIGRIGRPAFPAPSDWRAERAGQNSRARRGEIANVYPAVIARGAATQQSILSFCLYDRLLRCARNDGFNPGCLKHASEDTERLPYPPLEGEGRRE